MPQIRPGERILDLHAGDGRLSHDLARQAREGVLVGLTATPDLLSQARANNRDLDNTFFVEASASEIPWKEDYFSLAIARGPLDTPALREVLRVLAPEGEVFLPAGDETALMETGFLEVRTVQEGSETWLIGRKKHPTTSAG